MSAHPNGEGSANRTERIHVRKSDVLTQKNCKCSNYFWLHLETNISPKLARKVQKESLDTPEEHNSMKVRTVLIVRVM